MLLAFVVSTVLTAPPAQGLHIRVPRPSAFGATPAEAETVQVAVKNELEAEGYGVVMTADDAKSYSAVVTGTVTKVAGAYIVNLSIIRGSDHRVLDNVREEAKSANDLPRASIEVARQLGSALRLTMGVRARIKPKEAVTPATR